MRQIIRSQPSIERYACKLFLISEKEKKSCIIEGSEAKWSEIATDDSLQEEYNSITDKRNQMKKILASSISQTTGKENVIVVIDDLMDSSDAKMREIIHSQPSIERYACKPFLISEKEKKSCIIEGSEAKWSEIATDDSLQEEYNSITDKHNQMKKILASSISQTTGDSFNFTRLYDQDLYPRRSRDKLNYAEKVSLIIVSVLLVILMIILFAIHE
ncbi:uncharacterized protein LOC495480 [Xenopus laevis]|uniref:LOC495480 protein n=1 Tax=Xenopus laevis TaxID=8355 RepID=Q5U4K1_XENLA|nr:uncharacterized protein LOC495480 [Xenopus laevis]AAH85064.1 LOC495480 protein [Xenopus laevis]